MANQDNPTQVQRVHDGGDICSEARYRIVPALPARNAVAGEIYTQLGQSDYAAVITRMRAEAGANTSR